MATITFDTHLAVKQLTESGFDEKQAEAMVSTFSKAVHQGDLATKRDVTEIKADMRQMKAELEMSILRMALITIGATTALVSVIMGIMFQVMQ